MPSAIRELSEGRGDIFKINPAHIKVEAGFNAREDFDIEDLKPSIKENGVLQPLVVQQKGEEIILRDGERRYRTVMALIEEGVDIKTVPVRVVRMREEDLVASLLTLNSGKPLTMFEQGNAFARLEAYGWSRNAISTKTGKTEAWISNCLTLHLAPVEARQKVRDGLISASNLLEVIRQSNGDDAKIVKTVNKAVETAKANGRKKATSREIREKIGLSKEAQDLLIDHLKTAEISDGERELAAKLLKLKVVK